VKRLIARLRRRVQLLLLLAIASLALFYIGAGVMDIRPALVVAVVVLLAALIGLSIAADQTSPPAQTKNTLLTPTVVVNEVRAAALITYAQVGSVTIRKERDTASPNSLIKLLHDRLLGEEIVADVGVRVIAGVNLRHLREEDVQITGQQATITLLPAKVLMVYVDESLTRVVSHRAGWFTSRDFKLMDAARREAMEALVNAALENQLLEKAGQQAATAVAALARRLGFEQVNVHPSLPPIGAHFEELNDPSLVGHIQAGSAPIVPRDDQAGDA
jgi:hypothetical protein